LGVGFGDAECAGAGVRDGFITAAWCAGGCGLVLEPVSVTAATAPPPTTTTAAPAIAAIARRRRPMPPQIRRLPPSSPAESSVPASDAVFSSLTTGI
jgi:hypothetical protein